MITQVAKFTWKANEKMTSNMIPDFVDSVAASGGHFLIFQDKYIDVESVIESKTIAKKCILNASNYYLKYLAATNEGDKIAFQREMRHELIRAGVYSCLYMLKISPNRFERIYLEVPEFVKENQELKKSWDQGFSDMENN